MTASTSPAVVSRRRSDWLGIAFVAVIWCIYAVLLLLLDVQSFAGFLVMIAADLIMSILFAVWWFTRRSFTRTQRLITLVSVIVFGVLVGFMSAPGAMPPVLVEFGLPVVLTLCAVWIFTTSHRAPQLRFSGLIGWILVGWCAFLLIRVDGMKGNMRPDWHWRWTPTAEQMYLAQQSQQPTAATQPATRPIALQPGDWPGFRGPGRDGIVRGLHIALDWQKSPPPVLWRQRVGPAWSSMAVVDGCVFTQEQRVQREAVVCRDALTGREVWVHENPGRFDESMSGPGPRATPTFAAGRIFAQGALGTLDCLDAATGRLIWTRDIRTDAGAPLPMWGFSGSPLVIDDRVIVFAGGDGKKSLLAYSVDGGAPVWTADAGKVSYASPQQADLEAEHQVLIFANEGLFAVDPATGQTRWKLPIEPGVGVPSAIQACRIDADSLVLGNGVAFGIERIRVSADGRSATRGWVTRRMKPSFSDMVYHDGFIYGFDGTVFCCVDANTGDRKWRDGGYGAGQVVLLADQGVMIVTSEDGQVILLRCNPQQNEELGRVQAVSGKAWNHPAVAGDRLYVRSDGEMACIELSATGNRQAAQGR